MRQRVVGTKDSGVAIGSSAHKSTCTGGSSEGADLSSLGLFGE